MSSWLAASRDSTTANAVLRSPTAGHVGNIKLNVRWFLAISQEPPANRMVGIQKMAELFSGVLVQISMISIHLHTVYSEPYFIEWMCDGILFDCVLVCVLVLIIVYYVF